VSERSERPAAHEYDPFYAGYIARVPEGDIVRILDRQLEETLRPLRGLDERGASFAYAAGKWTVREVVGHLCDAERVFAYRALRIARGDTIDLPGFDENAWAPAAGHDDRPLAERLDELAAVRRATMLLLESLPDEAWRRVGSANGSPASVRAIATVIAGHELHHRAVLAERYLARLAAPRPG